MNDPRRAELNLDSCPFRLRGLLVPVLLILSGCGPSKEQRAVDAYNRGGVYGKKGDRDKEIVEYTEAIRLKPDFAEAYYNRGVAYEGKGDKSKADEDIAKAKALGFKTE